MQSTAPDVWNIGHTGLGVVVATMDTGADATHPDLATGYRGGSNSWFDPYGQNASPWDHSGHGTQVMGLIAGGQSGGYQIGVAPDAQWIAAKIFDNSNNAVPQRHSRGLPVDAGSGRRLRRPTMRPPSSIIPGSSPARSRAVQPGIRRRHRVVERGRDRGGLLGRQLWPEVEYEHKPGQRHRDPCRLVRWTSRLKIAAIEQSWVRMPATAAFIHASGGARG